MYLCVPPPVSRPHLIVDADTSLTITKNLLGSVCHFSVERGVANEFSNALKRISPPELKLLRLLLPILVGRISMHSHYLLNPVFPAR